MSRWDGLDEFVAVAEASSFSRAAARLGLSTSHVSREVARLEDRLQIRLLYRTTRRVSLTDAGKAFLERSRRLIEERDELFVDAGEEAGEPRGHLRMTCAVAFGERIVAPLINTLVPRHPHLSITMELTNRVVDLVGEGYDLAIRMGRLRNSSLIAVRLAPRRLYLCASPGYLARAGMPARIAELNEHACLVGTSEAWIFQDEGRERQYKPHGRWRCNSGFAVLDAALRGLGVCQLPDFYVQEHLKTGALTPVLDQHRPADEGVWAVYPHRRHLSRKVSLVVDFLREQIQASQHAVAPPPRSREPAGASP